MGQKFVVYSIRVQPVFGGASLHTGEKQGIISIVVTQVDSNIVMRIVLNGIPIMSQQLVISQAPIIQQNFLPHLYCFYTVDAHIFFSPCLGFLFKIRIHLLAVILSQCPHPDGSLLLGYDVLNLFIVIVVDELNFVAGGSGVVVQIVEARNEEVLARVPE